MTDAEMAKLLATLQRDLGSSWVDVVEYLRDQNSLDAIARELQRGNILGAVRGVQTAAVAFASDVHAGYNAAAQQAADWLKGQAQGQLISYDGTNARATQWAAENRYDLRGSISEETRQVVQQAVSRGVSEGLNPLDIARDVRDSIGLTPYQENVVANYRRELQQGDYSAALQRELVNGNHGRALEAASRGRRTFTADDIDNMTEDYRQNWIDYRAETISRTEALRAAHQGTDELYQQSIDDGKIDRTALVRTWICGPRTKRGPRPSHAAMDNTTRLIGEAFMSGNGNALMYPGDPDAPVEDTANCRCTVTTRYAPDSSAQNDADARWS